MIDMAFLRQRAQDRVPDAGLAFFLMGMNAMVYLDPTSWQNRLQSIVADLSVVYSHATQRFHPNVAILNGSGWAIVVIQGTQGWQGWLEYVKGAGSVPWPLRPGRVFKPFADLAYETASRIKSLVGVGVPLVYTGHSLGAAVAPLVGELLAQLNTPLYPAFWFAQPRLGDLTFTADYPYKGWQLNVPIDPVPLLPADVIADLADNPFAIRGSGGYYGIGPPRSLGPGVPPFTWPLGGDYIAALAASIPDLRQSPHQTYWYIRVLHNYFDNANVTYYADYTQLLDDLGLFDPWPA